MPSHRQCRWLPAVLALGMGDAMAAGTSPILPLSPQLLSAPVWSMDGRRAAPGPHAGLGALPWGDHRAAGPGPGWAATRLAWPERRADVTDDRTRRLDLIPLAIGTQLPPTAPALETPPPPPGDHQAWQGQDSTQSPLPTRPLQPPSAGGKMHQRGLQRGAGMEAAAQAPLGQGAAPPHPPGMFTAEFSPPGHPCHAERSQAQILHRRGTLQVPGRRWRREELPALSRHRRGRSPALGAGSHPSQVSGQPWCQRRALVCNRTVHRQAKTIKAAEPLSRVNWLYWGAAPTCPLLPAGRCLGGSQGLSPPPGEPGLHWGCTGDARQKGQRQELGEVGPGHGTKHPDKGAARMPCAV